MSGSAQPEQMVCQLCKAAVVEVFPFRPAGREMFVVCAPCRDVMIAVGRLASRLLTGSFLPKSPK